MKLEINNFRCHENIEVEIPDDKVTLLSGYSGQGKSTILESVLFILYDAIKKPFTFGKKKCKASLFYKNIQITRQKGPNLLQVFIDKKVLENDVAQHWIVEEFGTLEQFYCACYIRQMEKHFFFTQGATQIMDFIQSIAFGKNEISDWKEKLQSRKKEYEEHITKYDGRIQQQELYLESDTEMDGITKEEIEKIEKKSLEVREEEINVLELEIKEKVSEKDKKLEIYHKYLNKKKQVSSLKEQMDTFEKHNIQELEQEFETIMNKLKIPVSSVKQELKSVDQELGRIRKIIGPKVAPIVDQKLPPLQQEKQLIDKIQSLLGNYPDHQRLKSEIQKQTQNLQDLEDRKAKLEISIQSLQWGKIVEMDCPVCHSHLFSVDNKLLTEVERPEKYDVPIPDASEVELGSVIQKIEFLKKNLEDKEKISNEIENLSKGVEWTKDLDKKIENYSKYLELTKKKSELTQKAENDKNLDSDQIQELEQRRQEIQRMMKQVHQFELVKNQYDKEKETLSNMEHFTQEDLSLIDKEINQLKENIEKKKDEIRLLKKIIQHKKDTEVLDTLYKERRKWEQKVEACSFLKQKTLEAESLYLDEVIEQLNIEINSYLEFIFDKTPMTLTFKTSKELKTKKEQRYSFDIDIFYKNEQYDSIAQLSGGESAKCGIAILLAFNKMLNSKFILLDESLNALDMESKLKVIDVLRNSKKTCVLVSHDEIQGVFDKIVSL